MTSVFLPWEPHEEYEKAERYDPKDKVSRLVGVQYSKGEEWRNNSRKNEEMKPKWKQHPGVDMTGDESKVQCCKNNIE